MLIVSRPGGNATSQSSNPTQGQWGSGFMTSGHLNPQTGLVSGVTSNKQPDDMDDFGDFSQGPSFPAQSGGGGDADFSDFQGAAQVMAQGGGLLFITVWIFYFILFTSIFFFTFFSYIIVKFLVNSLIPKI